MTTEGWGTKVREQVSEGSVGAAVWSEQRTVVKHGRRREHRPDARLLEREVAACAPEHGERRAERGAAERGAGGEAFEERVVEAAAEERQGEDDRRGDAGQGDGDGQWERGKERVERRRQAACRASKKGPGKSVVMRQDSRAAGLGSAPSKTMSSRPR